MQMEASRKELKEQTAMFTKSPYGGCPACRAVLCEFFGLASRGENVVIMFDGVHFTMVHNMTVV